MSVWYRLIGDTGNLSFLGCASLNGGGCRCGVFGGEDRFAAVIAMTLNGKTCSCFSDAYAGKKQAGILSVEMPFGFN